GPALRGELVFARETKRGSKMETLLRDFRFGLRLLVKTPGFTAVSLITLALGIGATTAMFTVVNGILLRPLPYKEPDRLVLIKERIPKLRSYPLSIPPPDIITFQKESKAFDGVTGFQEIDMDLTGLGAPVRIGATRISWNALQVLGVSPLLGRGFTEDEDQVGRYVAILSYGTWQQRFGKSPDILGQTLELDRNKYVIVGVMPSEFAFPLKSTRPKTSEIWVPLALTDHEKAAVGDNFDYEAVARIKNGLTLSQAETDAEVVVQHIFDGFPEKFKQALQIYGVVVPLTDDTLGQVRTPLIIL